MVIEFAKGVKRSTVMRQGIVAALAAFASVASNDGEAEARLHDIPFNLRFSSGSSLKKDRAPSGHQLPVRNVDFVLIATQPDAPIPNGFKAFAVFGFPQPPFISGNDERGHHEDPGNRPHHLATPIFFIFASHV